MFSCTKAETISFNFILELWRMSKLSLQRYDEISTKLFSTYYRTSDQMKHERFYTGATEETWMASV
jgi:hypothetical protein